MGAEKQFENKVKTYLKSKCCWYIKYWGGSTFTKAGIPDLICCCNGIFIAIELKAPKGNVSELQKYQLKEINKSGGIGIVLYPEQFEDFKELIEEVLKCNTVIHVSSAISNVLISIN